MKKTNSKSYGSITALMKSLLKDEPGIKFEPAKVKVKKLFPKSKFNERHLSWYKSALKRGALKGVR